MSSSPRGDRRLEMGNKTVELQTKIALSPMLDALKEQMGQPEQTKASNTEQEASDLCESSSSEASPGPSTPIRDCRSPGIDLGKLSLASASSPLQGDGIDFLQYTATTPRLVDLTSLFSVEDKIGEGGWGKVFRGISK